MTTTAWRTDVTELVSALLTEQEGAIDTAAIARETVDRIHDEEALRRLAEKGAREIVGEVMRANRNRQPSETNRSARWEKVRDVSSRLQAYTVPRTDGPNTPLLDCSADDLADVVAYYRDRQAAYGKRAEAFATLEARLRKAEAARVADLDADEVGRILNV